MQTPAGCWHLHAGFVPRGGAQPITPGAFAGIRSATGKGPDNCCSSPTLRAAQKSRLGVYTRRAECPTCHGYFAVASLGKHPAALRGVMTWHQLWNWLIIPTIVALFSGGGVI
jgi:hypothetical protein